VFKKVFNSIFNKKEADTKSVSSADAVDLPDGLKDLEHFVDYVVRALVDKPNDVSVETVEGERGTTVQVSCAKEDIGKNGKTISAIRALVNGAGKRFEKDLSVEVLD
jgi:predicted RNA-binding protein YlqC (UPF0109 family)